MSHTFVESEVLAAISKDSPVLSNEHGEPLTLAGELASVLNRHSAENGSNTPDFILAEYMLTCLAAFNIASLHREAWYGKDLAINVGTTDT